MRTVDPGGNGPDADEQASREGAAEQPDGAESAPPEAAVGDTSASEAPSEPTPEERIATLEREKQETYDRLLRTAADLDNFRKRARRDVEEAGRRAREEALAAILAVADNLERALDHADDGNVSIHEGVRLVHRQLLGILEKFEVKPFDSVGTAFNPEEHDAVGQEETSETPPGAVSREMLRGYRIGDRILRPAMVMVAKPPAATEESAAADAASGQSDGENG